MSYVDPFATYTPPSHIGQQAQGAPSAQQQVGQANQPGSPSAAQMVQSFLHPAVAQAATTPGMSLSPQQLSAFQSSMGGRGGGQQSQQQPLVQDGTNIQPGQPGYPVGSIVMAGKMKGSPAITNQQILTQQWGQLADTSKLTAGQVSGPAGQSLAQQLAKIASQLPNSQATQLIKQLPTSLQSLVNNYIANPPAPASSNAAAKPFSDPLALQTMYKDVFGPAIKQADALSANTGSDYISAMSDAIAGSHMSPSQAKQQMAEAKATGAMMQSDSGAQAAAALGAIPYDTMISALSTAAAQSQLTRAQGERNVAYGVGQTAAAGAGQTGQAAGNTAQSIAATMEALGLTGPSQ